MAWPAMLENLLQSGVFLINTALAGRLGAVALGAAGISNFLMFFSFTLLLGVGIGTLALVARAIGAGNRDEAAVIGWHGFLMGTGLSVIASGLMIALAPWVLEMAGASPEIVAVGAPYLRLGLIFAPAQVLIVVYGAILRGAGDTKSPMAASAIMTGTDGLVGYLLVFDVLGPGGLGLTGIAIAFSLARVLAAVLLAVQLWRSPLRGSLWRGRSVDPAVFRRLMRVGVPATGEQVVNTGGLLMFNVIGLQLGTISFAAQNLIGPISSIAFMPSFGLGVAVSALVGQSLGAGNPALARRYGMESIIGGTLLSLIIGLVFFAFPETLLRLFTDDPLVIEAAVTPMRTMGLIVPMYGAANCLPGALRGAGDTRATFLIALIGLWMFRLPVAWVLGIWLQFGLLGVWLGAGADFFVRSIASYVRFASNRWANLRM